jgi:hypothetical protein
MGPRACGQQRSITVPRGQSEPQLNGLIGRMNSTDRIYGLKVVAAMIGLAVPGRPIAPWSRRTGAPQTSATGRNRPLGPCWVRGAPGPQGHERSPTVTSGEEKQQVGRPPAQAARTTPASGSDCGPEGRGFESPRSTHVSAPVLGRTSPGRPGKYDRRGQDAEGEGQENPEHGRTARVRHRGEHGRGGAERRAWRREDWPPRSG